MSAELELSTSAVPKKDWMSEQTKNDLARLAMAGASSVIAQFFTHPVETVKIRMQVEGNALAPGQVARYGNVVSGTRYVLQHEGMQGLYKVGFIVWNENSGNFLFNFLEIFVHCATHACTQYRVEICLVP
jgi:hypothetical protein